jgi:hypothetical protein
MSAPHPVHALLAKLEAERLKLVKKLAADSTLSNEGVRELANLQAALTAVREEIEAHGPKVGWGDETGLD